MNRPKRVLLLSGAPGTGKTTVKRNARRVFSRVFGMTAALSTDDMFNIMDLHWESRGAEQAEISSNARKISAVVASKLLLLDYEFVLIEGNALFEKGWVEEILRELSDACDVYHITLHASVNVVETRVNERGDGNKDREWLLSWLTHIEKYFDDWTYVIDSSSLTEEEMMESIIKAIQDKKGLLRESRLHTS